MRRIRPAMVAKAASTSRGGDFQAEFLGLAHLQPFVDELLDDLLGVAGALWVDS